MDNFTLKENIKMINTYLSLEYITIVFVILIVVLTGLVLISISTEKEETDE